VPASALGLLARVASRFLLGRLPVPVLHFALVEAHGGIVSKRLGIVNPPKKKAPIFGRNRERMPQNALAAPLTPVGERADSILVLSRSSRKWHPVARTGKVISSSH
jgi:hypothetical protein